MGNSRPPLQRLVPHDVCPNADGVHSLEAASLTVRFTSQAPGGVGWRQYRHSFSLHSGAGPHGMCARLRSGAKPVTHGRPPRLPHVPALVRFLASHGCRPGRALRPHRPQRPRSRALPQGERGGVDASSPPTSQAADSTPPRGRPRQQRRRRQPRSLHRSRLPHGGIQHPADGRRAAGAGRGPGGAYLAHSHAVPLLWSGRLRSARLDPAAHPASQLVRRRERRRPTSRRLNAYLSTRVGTEDVLASHRQRHRCLELHVQPARPGPQWVRVLR
mmetsp:Transcript_5868/g.11191  ORF Transcript_5868/g.11191 Transcript_5868/m.11191 type:complete len:273 (+) Transcript_5868:442-1260(+)